MRERIEGEKGRPTHSDLHHPPSCSLRPFWEQMPRSHQQAMRGPLSVLKGLTDWVLPSLMSITLCLPSADPSFDLPVLLPYPQHIPASSSLHLLLLSRVWQPTSWLLLEVRSENHECAAVRELRDWDTMEHRDTAWRAVSPSGGLIFSTGGPACNVNSSQLAGICAYLDSEDIGWYCVCEEQAVLCWLLWRRCKCGGLWCASVSLSGVVWCGGRGPKRLQLWVLWSVPLRWAGLLLSFFEAKNSPVMSPLQLEDVCVYVCVCLSSWLCLCSCLLVSVTANPCAAVFKGIIQLQYP